MNATYHILYVDDESSLLDIGKIFLEQDGQFSVDIIPSAPAALTMINAKDYDAIISDYQMPKMDGIEFLKRVRASGNTTPFILFTGRGREEVVIQALNEGADFYLQKGGDPVAQFAELVHKIRQAVQQRRAEASILDHERREADIINFLPDATFAIDTHGVVIAWNRAMEEMTGVRATEMLGKGNYEYSIPVYRERRPILIDLVLHDDPAIAAHYPSMRREGRALVAEAVSPNLYNGKGAAIWFTAAPLYNTRGEIIGAIESIRDITERKRAEHEITYKNILLSTQQETSLDGILIVDENAKILNFNRRFIEIWGIPDNLIASRIDEPVLQYVTAQLGDPEVFLARVRYLYDHKDEKSYEELFLKDGRILERFSAPIQGEQGKYYGRVWYFRDITERKRAVELLKSAKEYAEKLIQTANAIVVGLDNHGKITLFNPAAEAITGYTSTELVNCNWFEVIVPRDRYPQVWEEFNRLIAGGLPKHFENPMLTKFGDERYIIWKNSEIRENEQIVGTLSFGIDITERKRAEEALRESEERYRSILENIQDVYYQSDTAGNFLMVSPSVMPMLGFDAISELLGKNIAHSIYYNPEERSELLDELNTSGSVMDYEVTLKKRDGTPVCVSTSSHKYYDPAGNYLGIEGVFRDITERKRVENALQESEEKYRRIVETANEGVWVVDQDLNTTFVNQRLADILGYSREEIVGKNVMDYVIDEGKAVMKGQFVSRRAGIEGRYECKLRHRNGREVWCLISGSPLTDDTGSFKGSFGMVMDITERKQAEEQITQSEAKYRMLFESSRDALMTIEPPSYRFTSCNAATLEMFGVKDEAEFLSLGPWDISPETQPDGQPSAEKSQAMIDVAMSTGSHFFEWTHQRRNGETFPSRVLISKVTLGKKTVLQATVRDITALKEAENRIAQQSRNLSILNEIIITANRAEDLRELLEVCLDNTLRLLKYDGGGIYLVEAENKTASLVHTKDLPEEFFDRVRTVAISKRPYDTLFLLGEPIITDNSAGVTPAMVASGFRSLASIPLVARGKVIGALNVASRKRETVTDQERAILLSIGKELGTTINRMAAEGELVKRNDELSAANEQIAAIGEELRQQVEEIGAARQDLQNSETRYRNIVEDQTEFITRFLPDGTHIFVNDAYCRYFGLAREDIVGHRVRPAIHADDRAAFTAFFASLTPENSVGTIDHRIIMPDGTTRWQRWSDRAIFDDKGVVLEYQSVGRDITEHKQVEEHLQKTVKDFESLLNNMSDGYYRSDEKGNLILASRSIATLLGYPDLSECIGKNIASTFYADPEERKLFMEKIYREGYVTDYEVVLKKRDGSTVTVATSSYLYSDRAGHVLGVEGTLRDITERKQIMDSLRETERRLTDIINFLPDATLAIGRDGRVIAWNRAIEAMTGVHAENMIGKGNYEYALPFYGERRPILIDLIFKDDTELKNYSSVRREGNILTAETGLAHLGGKNLILWGKASPLFNSQGEVTGAIESIRDFTEQRLLEDSLKQLNRKLNLLSSITRHDIANNLTVCRGHLAISKLKSPPPETLNLIAVLEQSMGMIQTHLDFSRVYQDLGAAPPLWQEIGGMLQKCSAAQNVQVISEVSRLEVYADSLIGRVFYNLHDNTIRHGEHATEILVHAEKRGNAMIIIWEDNGIGVPMDEKEMIFERGFGKNTGLGLFLAREILSITGLTIRETGEPGEGARFEIMVPKGAYRFI